MLCKKCVLPESKPDIWLNEEGICNVCVQHEKEKAGSQDAKALETDFVQASQPAPRQAPVRLPGNVQRRKSSTSAPVLHEEAV